MQVVNCKTLAPECAILVNVSLVIILFVCDSVLNRFIGMEPFGALRLLEEPT